jgi:hypothetical protein
MKKLLSIIASLLLGASIANAQLVPRQTVEPGAGIVFCPSTDVTDSYTCPTATPIITSYAINMPVLLTVATSNTGAASVNIRTIGAITILAHDGSTLANNAITSGRPYLLIYNGTNFLLYGSGSGGGGASLSFSIDNCIAKSDGTTNIECSSGSDDGAGTISWGVVTGNRHRWVPDRPTAVRSHGLPDASGKLSYNRPVTFLIGADNGAALTDADDQPTIWRNAVAPMTIASVWCETDQGSSTINLQRDDGSAANILSSNLVCTTSGATSTSFSGSEAQLAVGHKVDFVMVTAATSGTPKRITVQLVPALDP